MVWSTIRDLVAGSGIGFEDRGLRALAGVPGEASGTPVRSPAGVDADHHPGTCHATRVIL